MKRAESFYLSPQWRSLRAATVRRDRHRCVVCGCDVSRRGEARVDHIQPRSTHPHLALDPANCRTLCRLHDAQGHREKGSGVTQRDERFVISGSDASGMPLDPGHLWNRLRAIR
jgi:5-methylcytosine-specific restriction endonuclease McrA